MMSNTGESAPPPAGYVTPVGSGPAQGPSPSLVVDGDCLRETLLRLESGWGGAGPIPRASLDAVLTQATNFVEQIVAAYDGGVAHGEVGAGGSATASDVPP